MINKDDLNEHKDDVENLKGDLEYFENEFTDLPLDTKKKATETKRSLEDWLKHLDSQFGTKNG